jgi:hypothetical protein
LKWPLRASITVYFVAGLGLLLVAIQMIRDTVVLRRQIATKTQGVPFSREENLLEIKAWLWLAGLAVGCYVFGFHLTFLIYPIVFGWTYGSSLRHSLAIGVAAFLLCWLIFDFFTGAVWTNPIDGAIGDVLTGISDWMNSTIKEMTGRAPP